MDVDIAAPQTAAARRRLTPTDLSATPAVDLLLRRLGTGPLLAEGLSAHPGRNDNWAGRTESGRSVFVKRIGGTEGESARRFQRVLAFERESAAAGRPVAAPRLLGSDDTARLLVFALVEDASAGSELAADDAFDAVTARRAGETLAALHALRPVADLAPSPRSLPPLSSFDALPWSAYATASAGTLETWRLLQGDPALHGALRELEAAQERACPTPVHGDVRLDQFLIGADGRLLLADWEEFGLGDPARDLGAFAGEWLHRAVLGVPAALRGTPDAGTEEARVAHGDVVRTAVAELERVAPLIEAFWSGYAERRVSALVVDPELLARATAFAGWHLLDRLLASASRHSRLTAAERAAAGIGRTALLTPQAFVTVLGWGGPLA
ncbi:MULTISPECIES: class V lanthionine synthetase subunit LxmK [Streptomyces]|uniref:Class V lanthionine synthetase subunit LxmK n=1 Tax=Streptomyces doudnae TaxID=3075536 RepID=A0ABD5EIC6_9ACTN|nr:MULTISPECIES: class V lanthionine synthetase subunit LxmK [unclassified Streptomyces]MDT0433610.1 class V lanthionine synthetase subunit LxmK [Streptomyces sp. DSM 41981]MYQ66059.1 phosphotransferase [Streptomyces sp. SID4950]SCE13350.1 Phosphotransferase enzyme family protein [Streptomyces sp. SolWspMP-5a-2]